MLLIWPQQPSDVATTTDKSQTDGGGDGTALTLVSSYNPSLGKQRSEAARKIIEEANSIESAEKQQKHKSLKQQQQQELAMLQQQALELVGFMLWK